MTASRPEGRRRAGPYPQLSSRMISDEAPAERLEAGGRAPSPPSRAPCGGVDVEREACGGPQIAAARPPRMDLEDAHLGEAHQPRQVLDVRIRAKSALFLGLDTLDAVGSL